MRILGVDPGSRRCGYGVIDAEPGRPRYVECGVIELDGKQPLATRLAELGRTLRDVLEELSPAEMAVEDVFHGVDARAALVLGHARGVVLATAGERGIPVAAYAPARVKKSVTGQGRAVKPQVAAMVRSILGLRRAPQADAADALAVALCHAYHALSPARAAPRAKEPRR